MQEPINTECFEEIIDQLEDLLEQESVALRILNRDALERITDEKLRLSEALSRFVSAGSANEELHSRLDRIRQRAGANQLLIAHARSCVRGILGLVTGQSEGYEPRHPNASTPSRVAFKG